MTCDNPIRKVIVFVLCAVTEVWACFAETTEKEGTLVYIGTYTGAKSRGIYVSRFDSRTGTLTVPELAVESKNPSFLAVHPNGRNLYAVGEAENFAGKRAGSVSAFRIDKSSGKLTLLNQQPSGGPGPCHLAVDQTGKCVLVANYGGGSIAALPIVSEGSLGEITSFVQNQGSGTNPQRQSAPHAHFIAADQGNRFALVCDLGLDKVLVFRLELDKPLLTPNVPPSASLAGGAGPRHLVFHPGGRIVYVVNEMGSSLSAFSYDPTHGTLKHLQTLSTLPDGFKGNNSCAEVQIHPSGKFVYASNRGHDSIASFATDAASDALVPKGHHPTEGKTPRHFALDPSGKWLLAENQGSDNITVFRVDTGTGQLESTGHKAEVGAPVCAVFVPGN